MNIANMKKYLYAGLMGILAVAFVFFAPVASAHSDHHDHHHGDHHDSNNNNVPRLYSITDVSRTTVTLPIKYDKFKGQTLTAIVSIKNNAAGTLIEKSYKVSTDSDGNGSIKVSSLKSGTDYSFKVRIINPNSGNSSDNSSSKDATTM